MSSKTQFCPGPPGPSKAYSDKCKQRNSSHSQYVYIVQSSWINLLHYFLKKMSLISSTLIVYRTINKNILLYHKNVWVIFHQNSWYLRQKQWRYQGLYVRPKLFYKDQSAHEHQQDTAFISPDVSLFSIHFLYFKNACYKIKHFKKKQHFFCVRY